MKTPVVLIIFKRPDTTRKVFEVIREAKPEKLYIIADGPRSSKPDESKKCAEARAVIDSVDWKCEVHKDYSDINLGCANRVSSGLDWVFSCEEEAIILEDDCLPDPTFFGFCEENLEKYRDDCRIMSITGQNVQFGQKRGGYSYYFSYFSYIWGWATWKRAWNYYDFNLSLWPQVKRDKVLNLIFDSEDAAKTWEELLENTLLSNIEAWDYRWILSCLLQNGLHIVPNQNLVSNIGFGLDSTNTHSSRSPLANISSSSIEFPLIHPPYIVRHTAADRFSQKTLHAPKGKKAKVKAIVRRVKKLLQWRQ